MAAGIGLIEGIEPTQRQALKEAGVETVAALLIAGRRPGSRRALAAATSLSERQILGWVTTADLGRIRDIGACNVALLKHAGVDTVRELRNRSAGNLAEKLERKNKAARISADTPDREQVQRWIDHAIALPLIIEI